MSEFLQIKIKEWVTCDNNINTLKKESKQLRESFSTAGNHIYEKYTYHRLVNEMKDLYRSLI